MKFREYLKESDNTSNDMLSEARTKLTYDQKPSTGIAGKKIFQIRKGYGGGYTELSYVWADTIADVKNRYPEEQTGKFNPSFDVTKVSKKDVTEDIMNTEAQIKKLQDLVAAQQNFLKKK